MQNCSEKLKKKRDNFYLKTELKACLHLKIRNRPFFARRQTPESASEIDEFVVFLNISKKKGKMCFLRIFLIWEKKKKKKTR